MASDVRWRMERRSASTCSGEAGPAVCLGVEGREGRREVGGEGGERRDVRCQCGVVVGAAVGEA